MEVNFGEEIVNYLTRINKHDVWEACHKGDYVDPSKWMNTGAAKAIGGSAVEFKFCRTSIERPGVVIVRTNRSRDAVFSVSWIGDENLTPEEVVICNAISTLINENVSHLYGKQAGVVEPLDYPDAGSW